VRHIPDVIIYLTGFISTIFFVLGGIYFSSNKTLGIWSLFGGIVCGLLTGFLIWQNDIWKIQENNKSPITQTDQRNKEDSHETPTIINAPKGAISFNQQGGITAGTVNINVGQTKRTINSSLPLGELKKYAGTQVFLHWRADDTESVLFKDNIGGQLNTAGWVVTQSAPHTADESMSNVIIEINRDSQHGDNSLSAALLLEDVLKKSKVAVSMIRRENNPLPANSMYLRIGPMR
jgi:hypothetical protein